MAKPTPDLLPEKNRLLFHYYDKNKKIESNLGFDIISEKQEIIFYYKNDIFILVNELDDNRRRLMYLAVIDVDTLNYKTPKRLVCEYQSTNFEKNWGPFTYKNKLHMLYDINPL